MNNTKSRDPALDIIRSIAVFSVIGIHFFLNTSYYDTPVSGIAMLILTILRSSFTICVPLFMMLTGYLIHTKTANWSYYKKIDRILYVYVIASVLCSLYRIYIRKEDLSLLRAFAYIFSFNAAPYSWYIEMYLGLFLLIPFLNIMYEGLNSKKSKQVLVATFLLLTALPSVLNIYCAAGLDWWIMPSKASNYVPLVPAWWTDLYPLTYFFLGKYLREYPTELQPRQIAIAGIVTFVFSGVFNYYRSYGSTFVWGLWQENASLLVTAQSALIFMLFTKLKYERLPFKPKHLFSVISDLSLGAYLASWIFDQIVYTRLNDMVNTTWHILLLFPVVVILVFIGSLVCSYFINLSYSVITKTPVHRR